MRIFKDSSESGQRKYIVDVVGGLPVILLDLNTSGDIVKTYIHANSQIIAQHDGDHTADRYFYLHDRLGNVRQVIDTSGDVKDRYTYDPFGELFDTEKEETISNPFKFTGQYFDSEIGQYYLRARQYDPHIARFTARDPIFGSFQEPLTLHAYIYCLNDPVNKIDPHGLWALYVTGTGMFQGGWSLCVQGGFVIDNKGNVGIITISGEGVGTPQGTLGMSFGYSPNAKTICDLAGLGWAVGASFSPIPLGFEGFLGDNDIWGYEVTLGASLIPIPEGHVFRTETIVRPTEYNLNEGMEKIQKSWEDAMYEIKTVGEGYQWSVVDSLIRSLGNGENPYF